MSTTVPYCEIDGLICSSVVMSIKPQPGKRSLEKSKVPGKRYGGLRDQGQDPKSYLVRARFWDEADMDDWLEAVNDIQPGAEASLFRSDRRVIVEAGEAYPVDHAVAGNPDGSGAMNFYYAEALLHCLDGYQYGNDQGIVWATAQTLPQTSALLSNAGKVRAGLDYLHVSGDYDASLGYTDDLTFYLLGPDGSTVLHSLELCDILMRLDAFRLTHIDPERYQAEHYYEADLQRAWADISVDLHGKTSGGSLASGVLTLDDGDYFYMPFYGPLKATWDSYLEIWASSVANTVTARVAFETDLSDAADISQTLTPGYNKIYIPDVEGEDFVAIGIKAAAGATNSISLTGFKGTVHRYVPYSANMFVEPDDGFYVKLDDGASSNKKLSAVELLYRNIFWS